ncbi:hypothetical protein PFY12_14585 [Chryseobacterium camelliae]|uniref:Uncharacterized protein n=1 Tax=Chryseobacterium camelliae TaxID=1265445 RepID=A0ABY7QMP3_9FLAO|nr:hypothetical protein [Chryseobacterium camelliae]WBV60252.1 hypothetical protein PFY12_14585 [Chryseobacterium camelliae]
MKTITIANEIELLEKTSEKQFIPNSAEIKWSDVKSINGYELKSLRPEVTTKHCYIYDVETQSNMYFKAPFVLEFK